MEKLDKKANTTVLQAANLLMITMVTSRVLGYLRDVIIFARFGQNRLTDAYNAAFSVPDVLYMLLVGGALSSAFIPVFSSYLAKNQEEKGWRSVSIIFNWIMILLVIGVALGMIFAPQLVDLLVPGFDPATKVMTVNLTRVMFVQVIFMSLSGITMGILHSYKRFTAPAIGSVLYNLGTIVGGLVLAAPIEHFFPGYGIAAFSVGVVLGAMLNFAVQLHALLKVGIQYHLCFDLKDEGVRELILLIVPVFIGLAASQLNLFVNQNLASGLSEGMVAALRMAQRLMQVPISIFGITVGVAFFPTMTALAAQKNIPEYKSSLMMGLRTVIFITIPASVGIAILREPIIRFMYEFSGGKFTAADTIQTGQALLFYTFGIFAYAAIHMLSRAFYALKDTKTPVWAAVLSIVVNVALSIVLVGPMRQGGLALAYSIAGIVNMVVLMYLLTKKVGHIGGRKFTLSFLQTLGVSLVMGALVGCVMFGFEQFLPMTSKMLQVVELALCVALGIVAYAVISLKLKMPEAEQVMNIFRRKFKRGKKGQPPVES